MAWLASSLSLSVGNYGSVIAACSKKKKRQKRRFFFIKTRFGGICDAEDTKTFFVGNRDTPCMPNLGAFVVLIFISSDHHHYHTLRQFCSAVADKNISFPKSSKKFVITKWGFFKSIFAICSTLPLFLSGCNYTNCEGRRNSNTSGSKVSLDNSRKVAIVSDFLL